MTSVNFLIGLTGTLPFLDAKKNPIVPVGYVGTDADKYFTESKCLRIHWKVSSIDSRSSQILSACDITKLERKKSIFMCSRC